MNLANFGLQSQSFCFTTNDQKHPLATPTSQERRPNRPYGFGNDLRVIPSQFLFLDRIRDVMRCDGAISDGAERGRGSILLDQRLSVIHRNAIRHCVDG